MADLVVYTTDQLRDLYLRDFKLRVPSAKTSRGTAPYVDAVTVAGAAVPLFKNASIAAERILISKTFGTELEILAADRQKPKKQGSGSFASVRITAAITGSTIPIGTIGKHRDSGESFETTSPTAVYFTDDEIAVKSVGLGRQTNVEGTLIWESPPAGLGIEAEFVGKAVGGTDVESDADIQQRLQDALAFPPADGNVGSYMELVKSTEHGVPVDDALIYPAVMGTGTVGVAFTVRGSGIERIPTAPQISAVETFLKANVPYDDCIFMLAISPDLSGDGRKPVIGVRFVPGETGFVDPDVFPKYNVPSGATSWLVNNVPAPTATVFSVKSSNGSYTDSGIRAGQTLALWDNANSKFVNKRILSFTGVGPYTITVDTSTNASNTTYVPVVDQYVSPWSDKLTDIASTVVEYYDSLTPGENTTILFDPGNRRRRIPFDSITTPYGVTSRVTDGISDRTDIQTVPVLSGTQDNPTVGTAGVNVFMIILQDLAIYQV